MPKFNIDDYELVKDRIPLFYERFPDGRIITQIFSEDDGHVTIIASLFEDEAQQGRNNARATGGCRDGPGGHSYA